MHVGAPLVAHQQASEAVQPGEAALHNPALTPQAGAVLRAATGDLRPDAAGPQPAAVGVVVVTPVGEQTVRATAWRPDAAAHRRHGVEQRQQLGDVVAVATGQQAGERDAGGVDEQVVF